MRRHVNVVQSDTGPAHNDKLFRGLKNRSVYLGLITNDERTELAHTLKQLSRILPQVRKTDDLELRRHGVYSDAGDVFRDENIWHGLHTHFSAAERHAQSLAPLFKFRHRGGSHVDAFH